MTLSLCIAVLLAQSPQNVVTLDEALRLADKQNLDLRIARARLDAASQELGKAWAGYLPQISVGGSYTRNSTEASFQMPTGYFIRDLGAPQGPPFDPSQEVSESNPPGAPTSLTLFPSEFQDVSISKRDQLGLRVDVNQAIISPRRIARIRLAGLTNTIGELSLEQARQEILYGVAQTYFMAVGLKATIDVQRRTLETVETQERDAKRSVEAGAGTKIDLLRAQIDKTRAEQDLVRSENAYRSAMVGLAVLLDREDAFEVALPEPKPMKGLAEGELVKRAENNRSDVLADKVSLELAEQARIAAVADYLPNINVSANYQLSNVTGFTGVPDTWAVVVAASWQLWDGGAREAQVRESGARLEEALAKRRRSRLTAKADVERAMYNLKSARANKLTAKRQVKLAKESLELVRRSYQNGAATSLEVSSATSTLQFAELSLLNESLDAQLAALNVLKAAGVFEVSKIANPEQVQ